MLEFDPFSILPDPMAETAPEQLSKFTRQHSPDEVDAALAPSFPKPKGRIITNELIQMTKDQVPQKDIASHFGVSPSSVCQAQAKLKQQLSRPAILDTLTEKEERFVLEIAHGSNQTQAALQAFDCTSMNSAKSIGSRLANDPQISEAIIEVMNAEGLTKRKLVRRLSDHLEGHDAAQSMRAVEVGLKLHGELVTTKNLNINANVDVCPVDLSSYGWDG